jgi:alanine dehydrogenase
LLAGLNVHAGNITHAAVAAALGKPCVAWTSAVPRAA